MHIFHLLFDDAYLMFEVEDACQAFVDEEKWRLNWY